MKLHIENNYPRQRILFYLFEETPTGKIFFNSDEHGNIFQTPVNDGIVPDIKPLISLPAHMGEHFISSVAEYASGKRINTENENLLKGKLEATEKHLEDMRKAFEKLLEL